MVAYSFQLRFVAPILAGTKGGTIRLSRGLRDPRRGQELQLYTGMRTKHCKFICTKTCIGTHAIIIDPTRDRVEFPHEGLEIEEAGALDRFAVFDGFMNWGNFRLFWESGDHRFTSRGTWEGVHVRWLPLPDGC